MYDASNQSSSGKDQQHVTFITIPLRLMKNDVNTVNHSSVDSFCNGKLLLNIEEIIYINTIKVYSYSSLLAHLQLDSKKNSFPYLGDTRVTYKINSVTRHGGNFGVRWQLAL